MRNKQDNIKIDCCKAETYYIVGELFCTQCNDGCKPNPDGIDSTNEAICPNCEKSILYIPCPHCGYRPKEPIIPTPDEVLDTIAKDCWNELANGGHSEDKVSIIKHYFFTYTQKLLKDKERIDYLQQPHRPEDFLNLCGEPDIREAIDKAITLYKL